MRRTPWGQADAEYPLGDGFVQVCTPSHGGIYVPPKFRDRIPAVWQDYGLAYTHSPGWYEEDCAWAAVAIVFPHLFKPEDVTLAWKMAGTWLPGLSGPEYWALLA